MDKMTLYGYEIEEDQGTLVIRISGVIAQEALRLLNERLEAGDPQSIARILSPVLPIGHLLSPLTGLREFQRQIQPPESPRVEAAGAPAQEEDPLSQGFDKSFAAFQEQMREFRESLEQLKSGRQAGRAGARADESGG
jgi:hypothetical protein